MIWTRRIRGNGTIAAVSAKDKTHNGESLLYQMSLFYIVAAVDVAELSCKWQWQQEAATAAAAAAAAFLPERWTHRQRGQIRMCSMCTYVSARNKQCRQLVEKVKCLVHTLDTKAMQEQMMMMMPSCFCLCDMQKSSRFFEYSLRVYDFFSAICLHDATNKGRTRWNERIECELIVVCLCAWIACD